MKSAAVHVERQRAEIGPESFSRVTLADGVTRRAIVGYAATSTRERCAAIILIDAGGRTFGRIEISVADVPLIRQALAELGLRIEHERIGQSDIGRMQRGRFVVDVWVRVYAAGDGHIGFRRSTDDGDPIGGATRLHTRFDEELAGLQRAIEWLEHG